MEVALNNKTWKSSLRVLAGLAAQLLWVVRCHVREVSHDVYEGVVTWGKKIALHQHGNKNKYQKEGIVTARALG